MILKKKYYSTLIINVVQIQIKSNDFNDISLKTNSNPEMVLYITYALLNCRQTCRRESLKICFPTSARVPV